MKKLTISSALMLCLFVSFALAQVFPPEWVQGPFPTGTEAVRNDAPCEVSIPDEKGTVHEYTAYRGTPVIDGEVDEDPVWNSIPWTAMDQYTVQETAESCYIFDGACEGNENYLGPEDITAWFKILWDDDNVYFALKKIDNEYLFDETHMDPANLGNIWMDDAYQIVLDTNDPFDIGGDGPSAEIGLALLNYDVTAYFSYRNTNGDPLALADGNGTSEIESCDGKAFFASQADSGTGYIEIMEVAFVKWDEIVADEAQMMSIMANDLDEDHIVDALEWSRGIFHGKLPERYASIVYSSSVPTAVENIQPAVPAEFALQQNYPNPFNPTTMISYAVNSMGKVELKVYDLFGQEVATLVNEVKNAGIYQVTFDASDFASGIYYYMIKAGKFRQVKKMVLVR
jgi:hypothetical protein